VSGFRKRKPGDRPGVGASSVDIGHMLYLPYWKEIIDEVN